jgi:hypothetical protein
MQGFVGNLFKHAPDFKGPITPEESVRFVTALWERATIEEFGGAFVSHLGNQKWV